MAISGREEKFSLRNFIDYIKFFAAIILIYSSFILWRSYDVVVIPYENIQMSPNFEPKEIYIGRRSIDYSKIKYGDILYYDYRHPRIKRRSEALFFGRVIGLPGDSVEIRAGEVYRNGCKINEPYIASSNLRQDYRAAVMVPKEHLYIMVDNRKKTREIFHKDSRFWGPILVYSVTGEIKPK